MIWIPFIDDQFASMTQHSGSDVRISTKYLNIYSFCKNFWYCSLQYNTHLTADICRKCDFHGFHVKRNVKKSQKLELSINARVPAMCKIL